MCQIFPKEKVYRHYRPDYLEYLELDVFIPRLNIGIEYQGIQHFKPIDHWGGKESLARVIERDKKKKKLCLKNGVKLIYFYYYEELTMKEIGEVMGYTESRVSQLHTKAIIKLRNSLKEYFEK